MSKSVLQKQIFFTFDYELFLGECSGSVSECLIEPTEKILFTFNKHGLKCIFFVDTIYLLRLEELSKVNNECFNDLQRINGQLKKIIEQGHYIFPHIHAHWLDAEYLQEQKQWRLTNYRNYTFSSLSDDIKADFFLRSVDFIKNITSPINPNYKIDCYRAGGWCIQPFLAFKPFFLSYGIVNDFSVMPGKYLKSNAHEFDFRRAPNKDVYHFDDDIVLEDKNGCFTEWTISLIYLNRIENWIVGKFNSFLYVLKIRPKKKGSTVNSTVLEDIDIYGFPNKGRRILASFDGLNFFFAWKFFIAIYRKKYFQFISHPKLLTNKDFFILKIMLFFVTKFYTVNSDYKLKV